MLSAILRKTIRVCLFVFVLSIVTISTSGVFKVKAVDYYYDCKSEFIYQAFSPSCGDFPSSVRVRVPEENNEWCCTGTVCSNSIEACDCMDENGDPVESEVKCEGGANNLDCTYYCPYGATDESIPEDEVLVETYCAIQSADCECPYPLEPEFENNVWWCRGYVSDSDEDEVLVETYCAIQSADCECPYPLEPEFENNVWWCRGYVSDSDGDGEYEFYLPTKEVDAWALINNIAMDETTFFSKIYDFMFPIGVVAGVAGIVMAGYTYMTSEGRPDKVKEANERLTHAVLGLIFIVLSLVILRLIVNTLFGANI